MAALIAMVLETQAQVTFDITFNGIAYASTNAKTLVVH